jgi:hypothetical protein
MTYIIYQGRIGDSERYTIQLDSDRVEALVSDNGACLRMDGEVVDNDLRTLIIEEMKAKILGDAENLTDIMNRILGKLGSQVDIAEDEFVISSEARNEIKAVFNEWVGAPDKKQTKVLNKFGLEYVQGSKHPRIQRKDDSNSFVTVSFSPSDGHRAGKNVGADIIKYLL